MDPYSCPVVRSPLLVLHAASLFSTGGCRRSSTLRIYLPGVDVSLTGRPQRGEMLSRAGAVPLCSVPNLFTPALPRQRSSRPRIVPTLARSASTIVAARPRAPKRPRSPSSEKEAPTTGRAVAPEAKRKERAARRQCRYGKPTNPLATGQTFLEKRSVGRPTGDDYHSRVELFKTWAAEFELKIVKTRAIDLALTLYMNVLFFEGYLSADGSKLVAGVGNLFPNLGRGAHQLLRAHKALKGWKRLSPALARMTLPWLALVLILRRMVQLGFRTNARRTALAFAGILRPTETWKLRKRDAVAPLRRQRHAHWSLLLHPTELVVPSKTGALDETVVLDHPDFSFLNDVLKEAKVGSPETPLFPGSYAAWHREFEQACQTADIGDYPLPVLHQLRHGGATHEMYTNFRSALEVQHKGRWSSLQGVRRYCKPGRVNQLLEALGEKRREHAEHLASTIGEWI